MLLTSQLPSIVQLERKRHFVLLQPNMAACSCSTMNVFSGLFKSEATGNVRLLYDLTNTIRHLFFNKLLESDVNQSLESRSTIVVIIVIIIMIIMETFY